jgi:hypothetical protein
MLCPLPMKHPVSVHSRLWLYAFSQGAEGRVKWSRRECQRMARFLDGLQNVEPRLPGAAPAGIL